MKTIGHHTLEDRGNSAQLKGPVISRYKGEEDKNNPFLGEGYYFWDDNLQMAKVWGEKRYPVRGFYIFEGKLNLHEEYFFDLVGNRAHQKKLRELQDFYSKKIETNGWDLAQWINFFKLVSNYPNGKGKNIFPYKYIRAADASKKPSDIIKFNNFKNGYVNVNPIYIICLFEYNDVILPRFWRIYP